MANLSFPFSSENVYTVTELTREIRSLLEENFSQVALTGEISNFHAHSSGHFYFTLKDENAQIAAVMFRGNNRALKFKPTDGLEVTVLGRVSVYEVRGNYQIIIESMEPKGVGSLQLAFEQLRKKLEAEGLFRESHKKPLPFLPRTVGIITSPTGAAIRDLIHVLHRRNPRVNILLYPVSVQGQEAAPEIAQAIAHMNEQGEADVLIVGRGGGSLEDLWAFNTEAVARAIFASKIPILSAVGHETDFTIADFVADERAPTPSAAAELAVPVLEELLALLQERQVQLGRRTQRLLQEKKSQLQYHHSHLKHPRQRLEDLQLRLDDLSTRVIQSLQTQLSERRLHLQHLEEKLKVLSPLSILERGYSIVHLLDSYGKKSKILKSAKQTQVGDRLALTLNQGEITAQVE